MRAALYLIVLFFTISNSLSTAGNTLALVEVTGQERCWDPNDVGTTPMPNRPKEIPCTDPAAKGQDGAVRAGVPFPSPRFTVNGDLNGDGDCTDNGEICDGTVTDNLTGLIWLQNANCFGNKTWADALNLANNLEDLGESTRDCNLSDKSRRGDWRLPNVKELQSLIDFGFSDPALSNVAGTSQCIDTDCAFLNLGSGRTYWSSTSFLVPHDAKPEEVVNKAWSVDVGNANTIPHFRWHDNPDTPIKFFIWPVKGPVSGIGHAHVEVTGQKTCWDPNEMSNTPRAVPCADPAAEGQDGAVRAGVPFPSPRFTVNGDLNGDGDCVDDGEICDGTVTDNLTGLIWLQNANCFGTKNWAEALDLANNLQDDADNTRDCGLSDKSRRGDWRLPNVKELQSLIDFGTGNDSAVALPLGHPFPGAQPRYYWSSTTSASEWDALPCEPDAPSPGEPDDAWAVSLQVGITALIGNNNACGVVVKNELRGVWLVRESIMATQYRLHLPLFGK
jgi:hypothetical protein